MSKSANQAKMLNIINRGLDDDTNPHEKDFDKLAINNESNTLENEMRETSYFKQ